MAQKEEKQRFFGYPKAIEAPIMPYKKADDANPVFRGTLLVVGAWLVSKLEFVQRFLWSNAGFDGLRKLDHLDVYTERWDVCCSIALLSCSSDLNDSFRCHVLTPLTA